MKRKGFPFTTLLEGLGILMVLATLVGVCFQMTGGQASSPAKKGTMQVVEEVKVEKPEPSQNAVSVQPSKVTSGTQQVVSPEVAERLKKAGLGAQFAKIQTKNVGGNAK